VKALKMKDEKIEFHAERCIGCGLCVTTCPVEALKLEKKPYDSLYTPPATVFDTYEVMSGEKIE
jgi:Na+-translocating ferredoxin:NAD+ oxidoreductase subunit B